jgi:hypothetical protein
MNKAMSLIVVVTALPARLGAVPFDTVNGYCSPRHDAAGADAQPDRHSRPTRPLAGMGAVDANGPD